MTRTWKLRPVDNSVVDSITQNTGCSPLMARLLAHRGLVDPKAIHDFLNPDACEIPDPFLFSEMQQAVDRIITAVENNQRVLIHGDYDVDGITSTAIVKETLQSMGIEPDVFLPDRMGEGYGLQTEQIKEFAQQYELLITVDCGTTAYDAIDAAREGGMDVIVTDHHDPGDKRPNAHAVLNPIRPQEPYPGNCLSGAGVAWKLCSALRQKAFKVYDPDDQLELVALGMVADIMPLLGENRTLLKRAFKRFKTVQRPGLTALMERAKVLPGKVTPFSIGFQLGPRLNAAGRMEHPQLALDLLITQDDTEAQELAAQLDALNRERRNIETKLFAEACTLIETDQLNDRSGKLLVVVGNNWHRGVLGILAQRLAQRFQKSVFLLSKEDEIAMGSARALEGMSLIPLLDEARSQAVSCGGHAAAAGMKVKPDNLKAFVDALYNAADKHWQDIEIPPLWIDASIPLEQIDFDFMKELEKMEPFGQGNEEPLLFAKASISPAGPRIVGNGHLKVAFQHNRGTLNGIGFGQGQKVEQLTGNEVEIAFKCRMNEFQGRKAVNLHLSDIRLDPSIYQSKPANGAPLETRDVYTKPILRNLFKLIRDSVNENNQVTLSSAYIYKQTARMTDKEFETALQIFSEMNLLEIQGDKIFVFPNPKSSDLENSPTYRMVKDQLETQKV